MRENLPTIKSLIIFETAAKNCSFSKAALELHITQTAVSKQIINLEENLSTILFKRKAHHVELTVAGKKYLAQVTKVLNRLSAAGNKLTSKAMQSHKLVINIPPSFSNYFIPKIEKCFANNSATITINSKDPADFSDGTDIIIAAHRQKPVNCTVEFLQEEKLLLIVHPELFANSTDLHFLEHASRPKLLSKFLAQQNLLNLTFKKKMRFEHFFMIINAVKEKMGVGLVPELLIRQELEAEELINLHDICYQSGYKYYLTYPRHKYYIPQIREFTDWARRELFK